MSRQLLIARFPCCSSQDPKSAWIYWLHSLLWKVFGIFSKLNDVVQIRIISPRIRKSVRTFLLFTLSRSEATTVEQWHDPWNGPFTSEGAKLLKAPFSACYLPSNQDRAGSRRWDHSSRGPCLGMGPALPASTLLYPWQRTVQLLTFQGIKKGITLFNIWCSNCMIGHLQPISTKLGIRYFLAANGHRC